jgi:aminodeoxyfutalosine deaminase
MSTLDDFIDALPKVGLGPAELADLARNAVCASFLGEERKRAILAEIDAVAAVSPR